MADRVNKNNNRGSLTLEACITLPLFLCFFLLLIFFIKLACINMTLNQAVNETAKQLATSCYPITFLNDLEDELIEEDSSYTIPTYKEEKENIKAYISENAASQSLITKLFSGKLENEDLKSFFGSVAENAGNDSFSRIKGYFVREYAGKYFEIKSKAKYFTADLLMEKFCRGSFVDREKIKYLLVELPQGIAEYGIKSKYDDYCKIYKEIGCEPDIDNVIIAIEYEIDIPIPLLGLKKVVMRNVAVEKAWIKGSNGVVTIEASTSEKDGDSNEGNTDESENQDDKTETVYVTNLGERYHINGCQYLRKSKIPIRLHTAIDKGYTPCKICVLKQERFK